jgi:hypothetical protein
MFAAMRPNAWRATPGTWTLEALVVRIVAMNISITIMLRIAIPLNSGRGLQAQRLH